VENLFNFTEGTGPETCAWEYRRRAVLMYSMSTLKTSKRSVYLPLLLRSMMYLVQNARYSPHISECKITTVSSWLPPGERSLKLVSVYLLSPSFLVAWCRKVSGPRGRCRETIR